MTQQSLHAGGFGWWGLEAAFNVVNRFLPGQVEPVNGGENNSEKFTNSMEPVRAPHLSSAVIMIRSQAPIVVEKGTFHSWITVPIVDNRQ